MSPRSRRNLLAWLSGVLGIHLAALWLPQLLPWAYGFLLAGGLLFALPQSLRPLSLSALSAAIAAVLLVWPEAFESTPEPLLLCGLVAALAAALLAPSGAVTGIAALGAAASGFILAGGGAELAAPPPDLEANYQLIAVALVAGYLLASLRRRVVMRLRGGAAHV